MSLPESNKTNTLLSRVPHHAAPLRMGLFLLETPRAFHRLCHGRQHDHGTALEPAPGCHLPEVALQQVARVRGVAVRDLPFLDLRLQRAPGTHTEGGNGLCAREQWW